MKLVMNEKEMRITQELLTSIADQPLTEVKGVVSIVCYPAEDNAKDMVEVEINEKYITEMYKEANKWLPGIVNAIKGLIALIKSFISALAEKENSLLKRLHPKADIQF